MTRRKKLGFALLILIVLSQVPFAYRRYQLGRLHATIQQINSQPRHLVADGRFTEYKGVMHVHSHLGGHSSGTFEDILRAAHTNQLNFVVMTEHTPGNLNTAAATLKGMHDGILFINGNEIAARASERLFVIPGDESSNTGDDEASSVIKNARSRNALAVVAYPSDFKSWNEPFDGIEVYNVYTNAREINPLLMFFDGVWSYRSYPDLLFAHFYDRPAASLQRWDELTTTGRKITAVAGNDAHANISFTVAARSGEKFPLIQLDPYERSFRLVRMHVLVRQGSPLTAEVLLNAIREGNCFIAFDVLGDASGFSFSATTGREERIQGGEITFLEDLKLSVSTPVTGRIVLFRNGQQIHEVRNASALEFRVSETGVYRVEVYLPQLPTRVANQPWIISNAIYVR